MTKQFGAVVGIDYDCYKNKIYRVLITTLTSKGNKQYDWKFECKMLKESNLISLLNNRTEWLNIKLESNKVKGSTGSLSRFENAEHKPFVILSQLVNSDNKIIGYKIATYNGTVKSIPIKELIAYGHRVVKHGAVPIQNAIFVPAELDAKGIARQAHYKAYPGSSFLEELIVTNKNKNVDNRRVNTIKNEKTLNKLEEIYTKEQIEQLKLGRQHGVEIKVYANPSLSAKQMSVLREGLESGINVRPFAFPDYTAVAMRYYILELQTGMDIKGYLSPKYSIAQIAELSIAVDEGLDLSKLSDPNLSVRQMQERRIRLENNVFHDEDVKVDGSWI